MLKVIFAYSSDENRTVSIMIKWFIRKVAFFKQSVYNIFI